MSEPAACEYIVALTKDRIYLYNFPFWNENSAYMRIANSPCVSGIWSSIYITINKSCACLMPHKYMGGPLGPPKNLCSLWLH